LNVRADGLADRSRLDAEAAKDFDGEFAIRPVNAFGDENVVAGLEKGEN